MPREPKVIGIVPQDNYMTVQYKIPYFIQDYVFNELDKLDLWYDDKLVFQLCDFLAVFCDLRSTDYKEVDMLSLYRFLRDNGFIKVRESS